MSAHDAPSAAGPNHSYFLLRRLHSLSGLVPIGAFLFIHLLSNATVLSGPEQFQKQVARIHELPALVAIEIIFIFIPLLFHSILGFKIWIESSRPNAYQYPYGGNIRYSLQRITGGITFVFILYHLWQMHWTGKPFGGGKFVFNPGDNIDSAVSTARAIQSALWVAPFYALGIISSVFHLANGIWTSLITWGITIRPQSQRAAGYACATFGIILGLIGLGALSGFRRMDIRGKPEPIERHVSSITSVDEWVSAESSE